jgi:nitroimidazol reductase NimA-like FMN-containing flavoprotein (pyridoxamine 5'-phosphate oxidase superfamily)
MDVVENTLEVPLTEFLERPLFCFLGQTGAGGPRVSPLWFRWEDGAVWIIALEGRSYLDRVRKRPRSALAVVDFDPATGRVEHVGMRGRATVEPWDPDRARRLLTEYLGPDREAWDPRFRFDGGEGRQLIRFDPDTVVARDQSYAPSPSDAP